MSRDPADELRDWPHDFQDENGNYTCTCFRCGEQFIGHKRRIVCHLCAAPKPEQKS